MSQGLCDEGVEFGVQGRGIRSDQWELQGLRRSEVAEDETYYREQHPVVRLLTIEQNLGMIQEEGPRIKGHSGCTLVEGADAAVCCTARWPVPGAHWALRLAKSGAIVIICQSQCARIWLACPSKVLASDAGGATAACRLQLPT